MTVSKANGHSSQSSMVQSSFLSDPPSMTVTPYSPMVYFVHAEYTAFHTPDPVDGVPNIGGFGLPALPSLGGFPAPIFDEEQKLNLVVSPPKPKNDKNGMSSLRVSAISKKLHKFTQKMTVTPSLQIGAVNEDSPELEESANEEEISDSNIHQQQISLVNSTDFDDMSIDKTSCLCPRNARNSKKQKKRVEFRLTDEQKKNKKKRKRKKKKIFTKLSMSNASSEPIFDHDPSETMWQAAPVAHCVAHSSDHIKKYSDPIPETEEQDSFFGSVKSLMIQRKSTSDEDD